MTSDVIISSRVRLARNLADYPFPNRTTAAQKKEICEKVTQAFDGNANFTVASFSSLTLPQRLSLVERHLISREFASSCEGKELITGADLSIMVNEEDTFRIQSILPGFNLDEAYKNVSLADDFIDEKFNYAFDGTLGYLTACPTNLGCALRASVMVHLPALSRSGELESLISSLSGLGYTVRGIYGEGSGAGGYIYQISNMRSAGKSETDIIESLKMVAIKVVDSEKKARRTMYEKYPVRTEDRIYRSLAIAQNARILSEKEYFQILGDLSEGITCSLVKETDAEKLYSTLNTLLTATLNANYPEASDMFTRRVKRAEGMRKIFE
ncbi:MAG: ATP--guanido phosphotransferase [Clostridia bacterium]|nr:ATP--guanido phosphotransferase [Clostridia bacterium]